MKIKQSSILLSLLSAVLVTQVVSAAPDTVINGRATSGKAQPNDTGYWKELTWMTEDDFN